MKSQQTFLSQFFRNCILFFHLPVDFLLTFRDPVEKVPQLKEASKDAYALGHKLLKELEKHKSGGMHIYFVGSNAFRLIGINNDIDFLVEYATEDEREKWKDILVTYFGNPVVESKKFIKWESTYEKFPIEVLLSHQKSRIFRIMFDAYTVLRTDPNILAAYEQLKRDSVGVTMREYNRRQLYFFGYLVKKKLKRTNYSAANASAKSSKNSPTKDI